MKKKRNFTLIEIVAIIIFIVLISLISVLIISKVMNESKIRLYFHQIEMIEKSSENWGVDNMNKLSDTEIIYLNLSELIAKGYIKHPLKDPRTNKDMKGCILIKYNNLYSKYEYKYYESTCLELIPND